MRGQVDTIKSTIVGEGCKRTTAEDYSYEGAIVTQYTKEISTGNGIFKIGIMFSFKSTDTPEDYYQNLGLTIYSIGNSDAPEVELEMNRIENVLYKKLVDVTGKENVKRGKNEIYPRPSRQEERRRLEDRTNWPPWRKKGSEEVGKQ